MIWPGSSSSFTGAANTGKVVSIDLSGTDKMTVVWDLDDKSTRSATTIGLEYSPDLNVGTNYGFYYLPRNQRGWGDEWSELAIRFGTGLRFYRFPRAPLGPHRLVFVIDRTAALAQALKVWQDGQSVLVTDGTGSATPDGTKFTGATGLYYMARNLNSNIVTGRASVPKVYPYAFNEAQAAEASKPPEYIGPAVIDTTTQGNWGGQYGKSGYRLFAWEGGAHLDSRPAIPGITDASSAGVHTWAVNGTDVRSPNHPGQIPLRRRGLMLNPSARDDTTGIRVGPAYNSDNIAIGRMAGIQGIPTGETTCLQVNIPATRADVGWGNFISYTAARGMRSGERGLLRWYQRGISGGYTGVTPNIGNDPFTEMVASMGASFTMTSAWTPCEIAFTAARDLVPGSHFARFSILNSGAIQTFQVAGFDIVPDPASRNAGTLYEDGTAPPMTVTYNQLEDFEGWLRVYFYDYDSIGRQSSIQLALGDVTSPAVSMTGYGPGKWVSWPVRIPAGVRPTITLTHVATGNSTISALMLDREEVL